MNNKLLEEQKYLAEFYKHISTLSTFSLLIIVSFIEKVFSNPEWKFLIAISPLGFISTIISVAALFLMSVGLVEGDLKKEDIKFQKWLGGIGLFMILSFISAFLSLTTFFLKNYF